MVFATVAVSLEGSRYRIEERRSSRRSPRCPPWPLLVRVPQRPQLLHVLRAHLRRGQAIQDDEALLDGVHPFMEALGELGALGGGAALARVFDQIEEPEAMLSEAEDLLALADHHGHLQ